MSAKPPAAPGKQTMENPHGNSDTLTGVKPVKAYKNPDFLGSRAARSIRILCEYEETEQRMKRNGILGTVMIFGSARGKSREGWEAAMVEAQAKKAAGADGADRLIERLEKTEWLCDCVADVRELSRRLATWCEENLVNCDEEFVKGRPEDRKSLGVMGVAESHEGCARGCPVVVCTGGGPGFMEAANRGASEAGAKSMGMGISLPFEPSLNPYVSPELAFEFHYFFTRKFWMCYYCLSLIVAPGGFGTMDELFEVVTLRQTGKIKHKFPIILFGPSSYWKSIINWQALVEFGTISQSDIDQLIFTNSIEDALHQVQSYLRGLFLENDSQYKST